MSDTIINEAGGKQVSLRDLETSKEIHFTVANGPTAKVQIRIGAEQIHVSPYNLMVASQLMLNTSAKKN